MNSEPRSHPVRTGELYNSLSGFTDTVVKYLLPIIRYVGHKDRYYDALYRQYPNLVHEKRHSAMPSNVTIFDDIPSGIRDRTISMDPGTAYIFCLDDEGIQFHEDEIETIANTLYVVLRSPSVDDLLHHLSNLLFLQDISYSNFDTFYPSLISVDRDFRAVLKSVLYACINLERAICLVSSIECNSVLADFLFGSSNLNTPYKVTLEHLDPALLPTDRCSLIQYTCTNTQDLELACQVLSETDSSDAIIAILTVDDVLSDEIPVSFIDYRMPNLQYRLTDSSLIAHWAAYHKSISTCSVLYYSKDQIDNLIKLSNYDELMFVKYLMMTEPESPTPSEDYLGAHSNYGKLTLDQIIQEAQRKIMIQLQRRSPIADAASSAAGIPSVTFRKRIKRLHERPNLLNHLSNDD